MSKFNFSLGLLFNLYCIFLTFSVIRTFGPSVLAVLGTLNNQNRACNIVLKIAFLNGNFTIFSLEDARVASYRLRAPHNASVIGDPAEH